MPQELLQQHIDTISAFETVDDINSWLIKLGKLHTVIDKKNIRMRENYLTGCQNSLWIIGKQNASDTWSFDIDSEIYYLKGIGKILIDVFSEHHKQQILEITFHDFKPIAQRLPTGRQRGLQQMINRIHKIVNNH